MFSVRDNPTLQKRTQIPEQYDKYKTNNETFVLYAFVFAGCVEANVHKANWLRFCFRLFVFHCAFFSRNSYLHLQNKYAGSEDFSCRSNTSFYCFYWYLFSANIATPLLTITTTRASSWLNSSIVSSPVPIVKSSETRSLRNDLVSSCFPKSLLSRSLSLCLEVAFIHVFLSVGKTEVPKSWRCRGGRGELRSVTWTVL